MAERDIIVMSVRELKRLTVVQEAIDRHLTQKAAAELLEITERQVRRLVRSLRDNGEKGLVHKSRGRAPNNRISEDVRKDAIKAYKENYMGFGPTLTSEKLQEREGIKVSKETTRKWLQEEGLWSQKRKRSPHAVASGDSRILSVDRKKLFPTISKDPTLLFKILETMSRGSGDSMTRLRN